MERAFWAKGASYVNAERLWHMEGKRRVSHSIQNGQSIAIKRDVLEKEMVLCRGCMSMTLLSCPSFTVLLYATITPSC